MDIWGHKRYYFPVLLYTDLVGLKKRIVEGEPLVTSSFNVIMGGAALASSLAAEVAAGSALSELIFANVLY